MDPAENIRAVEIIDQHDGFSPTCVLALESQGSIFWTNIQSMRFCYEVAIINPYQIDMGIPIKEQLTLVVDCK